MDNQELTADGERLREALARRDDRYGNRHTPLLVGAFTVLEDAANPDRIAQSAHSMRELLEKLPKEYDGAPSHKTQNDLKQQLERVLAAYDAARTESSAFDKDTGRWSGSIDGSVKLLLEVLEQAQVKKRQGQSKSERRQQLLDELDPLGGPPPDVKSAVAKAWGNHESFFIAVSHHGKEVSLEEYREKLDAAVRFLADQLTPPVLDTFSRIDALIAEAEQDA
jgi:hypothetical protein